MTPFGGQLGRVIRFTMRNPSFTGVSVSTLALGLGGGIALFSLVQNTLIEPLAYPKPSQLVYFDWQSAQGSSRSASAEKFLFWREQSKAFEAVSANELTGAGATLVGGSGVEYVRRLRVSEEFFRVLGVPASRGRGFIPGDDRGGGPNLVVLSHDLWRRHFDSNPRAIGSSLRLGGDTHEVVGVMPADFHFDPEADLWTLLRTSTAPQKGNVYQILGRINDGVSFQQAQDEANRLQVLSKEVTENSGAEDRSVRLGRYKELVVGDVRDELWLLSCGAGLVFLICCINLSNLVIARMVAKAPEIITSFALGARWRHIFRDLVLEHSAIVVLGAVFGWTLARIALPIVLALYPESFPRSSEVQVGSAEALFALFMALAGLVTIALLVTARVSRGNAARLGGLSVTRTATHGRAGRNLRRAFVVLQIALSLAILTSTTVVIASLMRLNAVEPGFETSERLTFQLPMNAANVRSAESTLQFSQDLEQRLKKDPNVADVALVTNLPLERGLNIPFSFESRPDDTYNAVEYRAITPGYFRTLGIATIDGRVFSPLDRGGGQPVAIVNKALAQLYGDEREVVGQRIWLAKGIEGLSDSPKVVVGIVGDVRELALEIPPVPTVYVPQAQVPDALASIVYQAFPLSGIVHRKSADVPWPNLRRILSDMAPMQAVTNVRPLGDIVSASTERQQFYAALLGLLGGLALLLAALGVFGVTTEQVSQRTREMGLHIAFGADSQQVQKIVLKESLVLCFLGIAVGTPLAFGLQSFLGSLSYGAGRLPLFSLGLVATLLSVVTLVASFAPARRAARVDPALLLRSS